MEATFLIDGIGLAPKGVHRRAQMIANPRYFCSEHQAHSNSTYTYSKFRVGILDANIRIGFKFQIISDQMERTNLNRTYILYDTSLFDKCDVKWWEMGEA